MIEFFNLEQTTWTIEEYSPVSSKLEVLTWRAPINGFTVHPYRLKYLQRTLFCMGDGPKTCPIDLSMKARYIGPMDPNPKW